MNTLKRTFIGVWALTIAAGTAVAADMAYPEKCKANMSSGGDMAVQSHEMSGASEYQKELMDGMKAMNMNMMQGMMQKDADVSFICGMIAHHMGAISMSEAELKHGKNAQAREMAQKIIGAQKQEVAEMTKWLNENAD